MADTIDPRDLYSGVDYNWMQWILSERLALKALPAFAHAADDVIDEAVLRSYSWPMTINGSTVTEEKFREYSSYLIANKLNTEGKIDSDFEQSRRKATEAYRDVPNNLLHAKADYKRARSAKYAANARILGWNVARVMVPVATLAAIGGGLTAVGSLLTSSAFATMLGGTVGVGLFGLAAVGTVGYIGYKLVKSAIKWLSSKSKAKKARAIEDKRARLQEFERAEEALSEAKDMKKQRDNTRNKNNLYDIPPTRARNQGIITNRRNRITQIRSELEALKTGTFDPLKARESSIDSMDITAVTTFIANINTVLSTGTSSNITTLENELTTIQNELANLDKYAGQEEQVTEITTAIAGIRSTLVAPMKTEAEALRVKAQARYDSLAAGLTGAARTVNSEITRIRTKFDKMKHYEEARQTSLSVVSTTSRLVDLKNIAKEPNNADKYTETELADMLTDLSAIDLSGLSSSDAITFSPMINTLTTEINNMKGSDIIDKNRRALQLCKDKITAIEAADVAKVKIERKRMATEHALNSVDGKIIRLATLSTGTDVRHESVASLTDDELKELIRLESKVNAINMTAAERKISELQTEIDANEDAIRADIYSGVAFDFNMTNDYNEYLEICKAEIEALKDKIQEAKEEQVKRASRIGLENAVTAAGNAFTTISSTLTTFERLLAETDATLQAKSLADLTTYIADIDTQNATISAINWNDLEQAITDAERAFTAAGGTVDRALQRRISDVKNNIARVTTALSNYAGRKSSAQNIKTAKDPDVLKNAVTAAENAHAAVLSDLTALQGLLGVSEADLRAKSDTALTSYISELSTKYATLSGTNWADLINAIDNAEHTFTSAGGTVDSSLQTKIRDTKHKITDIINALNAYSSKKTLAEGIKNARSTRGGAVATPITKAEFDAIIANAKQGVIDQRNRMSSIAASPAFGTIDKFEQWLNNLQYVEHQDKPRQKFERLVRKKFDEIVADVDLATGTRAL